jgi:hypothetical protein
MERDLPTWLSLGVPVATVVVCLGAPLLGYDAWYALIGRKEFSFIEIGTVAFLLPAFAIGLVVAVRFLRGGFCSRRASLAVGVLMLMGAVGALYFGGEEMSWGQTYFQWQTPDSWKAINEQGETNLHNLELLKYGPWVDLLDDLGSNVPRQMLLFFCIVGMVAPPLLAKRRLGNGFRRSWLNWLMPTWAVFPICALSVCSNFPEKIVKALHLTVDAQVRHAYWYMALVEPGGELKEYCYGMVILFYFLSLLVRTSSRPVEPGERKAVAVLSKRASVSAREPEMAGVGASDR